LKARRTTVLSQLDRWGNSRSILSADAFDAQDVDPLHGRLPEALATLKERIKTPPDDGGLWTGPKVARWLAKFHDLKSVHAQRGWDALVGIAQVQFDRRHHPAPTAES
jgi:hypothetical protein